MKLEKKLQNLFLWHCVGLHATKILVLVNLSNLLNTIGINRTTETKTMNRCSFWIKMMTLREISGEKWQKNNIFLHKFYTLHLKSMVKSCKIWFPMTWYGFICLENSCFWVNPLNPLKTMENNRSSLNIDF